MLVSTTQKRLVSGVGHLRVWQGYTASFCPWHVGKAGGCAGACFKPSCAQNVSLNRDEHKKGSQRI